jgi:hypothetical protein
MLGHPDEKAGVLRVGDIALFVTSGTSSSDAISNSEHFTATRCQKNNGKE